MFTWYYTHTFEIEAPLQKVWKVFSDPYNWPKWIDQLESCHFDGELKVGSKIKCKVKTRFPKDVYFYMTIIDIKPYKEGKIKIKLPLMSQENSCILHELSATKTRIDTQICIKSLFVPFMRSYFARKLENAKSKEFKHFLDVIEKEMCSS